MDERHFRVSEFRCAIQLLYKADIQSGEVQTSTIIREQPRQRGSAASFSILMASLFKLLA